MSLPALYEIAQQFRELELLSSTDELPPEVVRDTLEGLQGTLEAKSSNVAKLVIGLEAEAKMIEDAAKQLEGRAARRKRRAESIRAYMLFQLQAAGITRVECPEFTIAVRKNPEAVEIDDPERIPPEFLVQPEPPPPPRAASRQGRDQSRAQGGSGRCRLLAAPRGTPGNQGLTSRHPPFRPESPGFSGLVKAW